MHCKCRSTILPVAALVLSLGASFVATATPTGLQATDNTTQPAPENSYIRSDDYKDGDEILGAMLTDADYRKILEDFEFGDEEFDWGWQAPGFDISKYKTVHLEVSNKTDELNPDIIESVTGPFTAALNRAGLEIVPTDSPADLTLNLAVVDYNTDSTFAWVTTIQPFIEIELRLKDNASGNNLLLIRNQEHSATPADAAADYAEDFLDGLR